MDIVTDLTSQAVACLTIIQDLCKKDLDPARRNQMEDTYLWELSKKLPSLEKQCNESHIRSIEDIIWCSHGKIYEKKLIPKFFDLARDLLNWLKKNQLPVSANPVDEQGHNMAKDGTLFCTPFQWRRVIKAILYHKPQLRLSLAKAMHYMPVQVLFCIGGKNLDSADQRLYQNWDFNKFNDLLSSADKKRYREWWNKAYKKDKFIRKIEAEYLLVNDPLLLSRLIQEQVAIPFETLFNSELDEVSLSRMQRLKDNPAGMPANIPARPLPPNITEDPLERAKRMELHGLAFSGGGIRSATFNLGVLQKLAEQNKLSRFDYLSTVSGGGYIGTWLASWIKRGGSVSKITDRLDSKKSADPLGEEVRPIRWLRMFSNYLAPDASIMSADSWTMGITWLRNTVINQVILLLLLCTFLSVVTDLFNGWTVIAEMINHFVWWKVGICSFFIFTPGVIMTGFGMQAFDRFHPERSLFNFGRNRALSMILLMWAIIAAYFTSAFIYNNDPYLCAYWEKIKLLIPAGVLGFIAMIAIAYIGYYRRCAQSKLDKTWVDVAIFGSSLLAAAAELALLAGIWQLFQIIKGPFGILTGDRERWVFIVGPPLILESISICVVIRMALMGKLFPDERREWWGRMGAMIHRLMFIWLLTTIGSLILPDGFNAIRHDFPNIKFPAIFGGWGAIIGFAVKLAYQSKDGADKSADTKSMVTETFIRVAPYLFMVGFLLLGAYTLQYVIELATELHLHTFQDWVPTCVLVTLAMAAITAFLSWRVGVNEFSLHHFYRNRLVRAYLGATRKRTDRDRSANKFTGFDKDDDIKLASFVTTSKDEPYCGPYPLINTTLNATVVSELDRQDRKAESFIFTPLYSGFDFSPTRSAAYAKDKVYEYGYRPTNQFAYENGPMIGTAMAISGAAVNPNMGYHSSPATAFMLTMFNVRLGWWIGNPRKNSWKRSDPTFGVAYLVSDLIGSSDIDSNFVCLSDGGHFDNMGLYELIRRRCTHITLCDAEEDNGSICEGLANAIRRCRIDFGVEITIDTTDITQKKSDGFSTAHFVKTGTIKFPGESVASGNIIYIKSSLTGNETTDIREYHLNNPLFPQQPTSDQFFTEEQFESYRKLGYCSVPDK